MEFGGYVSRIEKTQGDPVRRNQYLCYAAADEEIDADEYAKLLNIAEFMSSYEEENGPY